MAHRLAETDDPISIFEDRHARPNGIAIGVFVDNGVTQNVEHGLFL
jgi:hypothetical protein